MILRRLDTTQPLCEHFNVAESFSKRLVGLIGTKQFKNSALWIPRCNWIHTFFMSIPIDVVYIDRQMTIRKIDHALPPWRLPFPVFSAASVIEMDAGMANKLNLQIGDKLDVGH
ncbi:MAG: DUF192 domain-containing protein [Bdellovibrionaceae bacterium]|nr:DUF192 domain-containing protein [Pseudobdellovibrionaceae bacterium]